MNDDHLAGYKLLQAAALVEFDVLESDVQPTVDGEEAVVRAVLKLGGADEDANDVEWGAHGFIYALAVLSFDDARPRGYSEKEFQDDDAFSVADLVDHLHFEHGELHFSSDYVRGRCMKTDITVRADGRVTLDTRCRGEAALRWLDRLKGKKKLEVVSG